MKNKTSRQYTACGLFSVMHGKWCVVMMLCKCTEQSQPSSSISGVKAVGKISEGGEYNLNIQLMGTFGNFFISWSYWLYPLPFIILVK